MSMKTFKGYSTIDREWGNFTSYDVELAKRDLLNEFYTRKGERLMSPEFGSIVWDLLFDPLTDETITLIREDCIRIVSRDPRLELKTIDIDDDFDNQRIIVSIVLNYVPTATVTDLVVSYYRDISIETIQG